MCNSQVNSTGSIPQVTPLEGLCGFFGSDDLSPLKLLSVETVISFLCRGGLTGHGPKLHPTRASLVAGHLSKYRKTPFWQSLAASTGGGAECSGWLSFWLHNGSQLASPSVVSAAASGPRFDVHSSLES